MRRGFTMVELLVVIVIIGVMVMMVGPAFSTGSDVARVKTASRGVMQLSRYARSMALLHQTPIDLVFTSSGSLSVELAGGGGGEGLVSQTAFSVTNAAAAAAEAQEHEAAAAEAKAAEEAGTGGGTAYVMADVNVEKKYEQTVFTFEGYTDTIDEDRKARVPEAANEPEKSGTEEDAVQTFRVRYKSNGTCRPYRVRVAAAGSESLAMVVVIDVLGAAKIEDEDE